MKNFPTRISVSVTALANAGDPVDSITVNVPLMIRLLELAREEIKTDAALHELIERLVDASKRKEVLTMSEYSSLVPAST